MPSRIRAAKSEVAPFIRARRQREGAAAGVRRLGVDERAPWRALASALFLAVGCVLTTLLALLLLITVLRGAHTARDTAHSLVAGAPSVGSLRWRGGIVRRDRQPAKAAAELRGCIPRPIRYRRKSAMAGFDGHRMWGDPLLTSGSLMDSADDVRSGAWVFAVSHARHDRVVMDAREATWLAAASSIRNRSKHAKRDIVVLFAGTLSREAQTACAALRITLKNMTLELAQLCAEIDCVYDYPGVPSMMHWEGMWLRFYAWTLTEYEKVVYLDNDFVMLRDADELFGFPEVSAIADLAFQFSSRFTGYENVFNSGLLVLEPSLRRFAELKAYVKPYRAALIAANAPRGKRWTLPAHLLADQGMLNSFFAQCWNVVPSKYVVFSKAFNPWASAIEHRLMAQIRGGFNPTIRFMHFANDHTMADVYENYKPTPEHAGYSAGCALRYPRSGCFEWQDAYFTMRRAAGLGPGIAHLRYPTLHAYRKDARK